MNRTAALLLALTTLLAHCLLIHQDSGGSLAPPYEYAHAAFRQARNAVFYGDFAWNVGSTLVDSYPSPLWVFLCAIAERLHVSVTTFAQALGVFFVLAAVVVTAQFTRDRLAGVIAPLLLVVNGGLASAGAGGTEIGLMTFLIALAFLAQEERRPGWLVGSTVFLCLTRPEGVLVTLILFAFELTRRQGASPRLLRAFLWPAALVAILAISRWVMLGSPFSPYLFGWLADGRPDLGLPYLVSFFVVMGTPLLTVFPLYQLLRGKLVGRARRALALALFWILLVGWRGGDSLPFWNAAVPALPLLFLSIQDALTLSVDTESRLRIGFVWAVLLLTCAVSVFASKLPGKFGPIPGLPIPDAWWPQDAGLVDAYARTPGRLGLAHEINETERLRCIGIFIRDHLSARASVLTPWPGAIGYLSRREVFDLRGRASTLPGVDTTQPWYGTPRGDVVSSLKRRPDYVLAWIDDPEVEMPPTADLMRDWLERYDRIGPTPEREAELVELIADYELIVVPVPARSSEPDLWSEWPVYFYRRRDLGLTPKLKVQVEDRTFAVYVKHRGHRQRIDLDVMVRDTSRGVWSMRPTGKYELDAPEVRARKQILLYPTGTRWLQLLSGEIPDGIDPQQLTAVLRNPGITDPTDSKASNESSTRFDQ